MYANRQNFPPLVKNNPACFCEKVRIGAASNTGERQVRFTANGDEVYDRGEH